MNKSKDNEIMWEQFITESPWLTQPIPNKFTADMLSLDIRKVESLNFLGNNSGFDTYEEIAEDGATELFFVKNHEIQAYYRYQQKSSGQIQTKMAWNNPKNKGSFIRLFGDYIIPRFKVVESDDMLTQSAFDLWKRMIGGYTQYNYYAKLVNKLIQMTNPYDVHSYEEKFNPGKNSTFIVSVDPLIKKLEYCSVKNT